MWSTACCSWLKKEIFSTHPVKKWWWHWIPIWTKMDWPTPFSQLDLVVISRWCKGHLQFISLEVWLLAYHQLIIRVRNQHSFITSHRHQHRCRPICLVLPIKAYICRVRQLVGHQLLDLQVLVAQPLQLLQQWLTPTFQYFLHPWVAK